MANLQTDIDIFINRAQQKIGTLGDIILADDKNGLDLSWNISLSRELSTAVYLFQNATIPENFAYKIIHYLSEKADLYIIPLAIFDDTFLVKNVLLPSGGYVTGPAGPKGDAATITLGTVTTGAAGSSVVITNSGNTSAAILNFTIPRGDNGADGTNGDTGWSATYALIADSDRIVLKVVGWIGGTGTPPTTIDVYLGTTGFVSDIADAVDVRGIPGIDGSAGADGYNGWSPIYSIQNDSTRRVLQVIGWTGGTGIPPDTGDYMYSGGLTPDIATATDIRGPQGIQGDPFTINARGDLSDRNLYDDEGTGFTFLAEDTGDVYIKNSPLTGDWSPPISFVGEKGWSPIFNVVEDGQRILLQVSDWVGGQGDKPTNAGFIYPGGLTFDASDATDFRGTRGEFFIDESGPLSDRSGFDSELRPFTYYATDNGKIYLKNSDAPADWTIGFDFRGERGPEGPVGSQGSDGSNAFTTTTSGFTVPAINSDVNINVIDTAWMAVGQIIYIETAGHYQVVTPISGTVVTVKNVGYTGNAVATTIIASGQKVSPAGVGTTGGGTGTVTSVSVASANGFAGSVANATTTPAITLSTTITGIIKGNGTAISAAVAGTDYVEPSALSAYLPLAGGNMSGIIKDSSVVSSVDPVNRILYNSSGTAKLYYATSIGINTNTSLDAALTIFANDNKGIKLRSITTDRLNIYIDSVSEDVIFDSVNAGFFLKRSGSNVLMFDNTTTNFYQTIVAGTAGNKGIYIDKGNLGTRMSLFVSDGSGGLLADEAYTTSNNSGYHILTGSGLSKSFDFKDTGAFVINNGGIEDSSAVASANFNTRILYASSAATVADWSSATTGIIYTADFSGGYVARSLVDRNYVDNLLTGITWKNSVVAATTASITLSGAQTIDGISVIAGDRVLVKNQSTATQNGLYLCASGSWTRTTDADTGAEIAQATVLVEGGTVNASTQWNCNNTTITIGVTNITFVQIAGAGVYTNGTGLSLTGNVFSISTGYVGQTSITTLGTIGTGTWNGTAISPTYGGTGVNNGASTITLGGNLTTSGAFTTTFTVTANTSVTLPTSGTLVGGTGTSGQVSYWNGTNSQTGASSFIFDSTNVLLGIGSTPSAKLHLSGNISATSWTTNGIGLRIDAATYTNTTSSGTVASIYTNLIGAATYNSSSSTTYTDLFNIYIKAGIAGTSTTITNNYAVGIEGDISLLGGNRIIKASNGLTFALTSGQAYAVTLSGSTKYGISSGGNHTFLSTSQASGTTPFMTFTQSANTGGACPVMLITAGASTSQTTATEVIDINYNLSAVLKSVDGTIATQRTFLIQPRTYTPQTTALTLTDAVTLEVGVSIAGSGTTITRNWAARLLGNVAISTKLYVGASTTAPTALIHLAAGTATAGTSPLVFTTSGSGITGLLTTAIKGSMEFSDYGLWFTPATTRHKVWEGLIGASAPSTSVLTSFTNYYGTSGTVALSTPNTWITITGDDGNTYKVPAYS